MVGYAMMLAMKEVYKFRTLLSKHDLSELKKYFRNIDQIQPVESICEYNCNWTASFMSPHRLAKDPKLSKGKLISYMDNVST